MVAVQLNASKQRCCDLRLSQGSAPRSQKALHSKFIFTHIAHLELRSG